MAESFTGNIWKLTDTHWIVVPTNIGWTRSGANVMGRGIAYQACCRNPLLASAYGNYCKSNGAKTKLYIHLQAEGDDLICIPTKPLDTKAPWLSWRHPSSLPLTIQGIVHLAAIDPEKLLFAWSPGKRRIAVPLLGAGNGWLNPLVIRELLDEHLKADYFTIVEPED